MRVPESVLVPADLCGQIALRLMRDHREQSARNGGTARLPDRVTELLAELDATAKAYAGTDIGTMNRHIRSDDSGLEASSPGLVVSQVAAERAGISARRVRKLCQLGRIPGATKSGSVWLVPSDWRPESRTA